MKKMIFLLLTLIVLSAASAKAQVLISPTPPTTGPNPAAVLELRSDKSGLLLPQVDLNAADDTTVLKNPAAGMLVCNLDGALPKGVYYYTGSLWKLYIGF